jgi:hypothetical protein
VPVLSDGSPSASYELVPGAPVVKIDRQGNIIPASVTCEQRVCEQRVTVGNGLPEVSEKTLKYRTSADGAERDYSGAVTVSPSWQ